LCYAFGKDEWAKKVRYKEDGKRKKKVYKFTKEDITWMEDKAQLITEKLIQKGVPVDPFRIETVACAYKKTFRDYESRYVGYYLDRQAEDIRALEEKHFDGVDWGLLWEAREECLLPRYRRNSVDKGMFKVSYEEKIGKEENEWF
jgi:hypothetical protein